MATNIIKEIQIKEEQGMVVLYGTGKLNSDITVLSVAEASLLYIGLHKILMKNQENIVTNENFNPNGQI